MSPEFARILTVAIYLLTTLVWLRDGGKWTWGRRSILGAGILLLAATDRYFGFSHMLCDFLRKAAQEQGWYEARRWLQTIATLLIVSGIVALALIYARFNSRSQSGMRITARAIFLSCYSVSVACVRFRIILSMRGWHSFLSACA
jgi:hypothetical protein